MKKTIISTLVLLVWATSTFALITREQADAIVINYLKNEGVLSSSLSMLFVNTNTPSEEGFGLTTSAGETVKAKYACWVYLLTKGGFQPAVALPSQQNYLFVKEDNGSLLEIIVNDFAPNLNLWTKVDVPSGLVEPKENNKSLYPNPVDDWLTIPCNGENTRVEIYDLKGSRLFSGLLSETCQLNVSFLNAGVYMVNVDGKMYKIIKS